MNKMFHFNGSNICIIYFYKNKNNNNYDVV